MVVQYTVSLMTVACIIQSHSPLPVVGGTTQRCVRGRVTEAKSIKRIYAVMYVVRVRYSFADTIFPN